MSTPTAIEIVREYLRWRLHQNEFVKSSTLEQTNAALASVLRDAERFKALERAPWLCIEGPIGDRTFKGRQLGNLDEHLSANSLAELADKLKEAK